METECEECKEAIEQGYTQCGDCYIHACDELSEQGYGEYLYK